MPISSHKRLNYSQLVEVHPECGVAPHNAEWWHGSQLYGDGPYIFHLHDVAFRMYYAGFQARTWICAAYFHDLLEDTSASEEWLKKEYGQHVYQLVNACTGKPYGRAMTRQEHNEAQYKKIAELPEAANLKVCDRLSNLSALISNLRDYSSLGPLNSGLYVLTADRYYGLLKRYFEENEAFSANVAVHAIDTLQTLYNKAIEDAEACLATGIKG